MANRVDYLGGTPMGAEGFDYNDWNDSMDAIGDDIGGKFNATTGHDHDGVNSKVITKPFINQIYTGTGLNMSVGGVGTTQTTETSVELTAISSTNITKNNSNYVCVDINGLFKNSVGDATGTALLNMKIQIKEGAGAYSDIFNYKEICYFASPNTMSTSSPAVLNYTHTLTSGQKTNGCQFKIFVQGINLHKGIIFTLNEVKVLLQ